MDHLLYDIAITKIPQVGPIVAKSLISYCGGAKEVFLTPKSKLIKIPNVGQSILNKINNSNHLKEAEKILEFAKRNGIEILSYRDKKYPQRLNYLDDSPILLYYKGTADLNHLRVVSLIGTRIPSQYGIWNCEKIVEGLKAYNVLILSGLAYGIDSVAHKAAIIHQLPTVAVLGHGLDRIYPLQNRKLASEILKSGGLLTEFPNGTLPDRENFPMRNRIIAAMSDAIIVLESGKKGGSMITAEYGNSYNKDVFALPGRVNDEKSKGNNLLIKQHKAHLVESSEDIIYIMRWEQQDALPPTQAQLFHEFEEEDKIVYDYIKKLGEIHLDRLHHDLNIPLSQLASLLLNLEFKGVIKSLPGKRYIVL